VYFVYDFNNNNNTAESARCGAPRCAPPQNFSNFCLEIACYSAFWEQFFRLDSSLFTDEIVTLTQRQVS